VRTVLIIFPAELIEAMLLVRKGSGRRSSRVVFEGLMDTFVTAVLLRVARLNALRMNPKVNPSITQPAQDAQAARRKRRAVVGMEVTFEISTPDLVGRKAVR